MRIDGGVSRCGSDHRPLLVKIQWWFSVTGTVSGAPFSFQSGISSFSATGSITAPERIWAPISLPFSRMQTDSSCPASLASCLSRMRAHSRPAGLSSGRSPRHRASGSRVRSCVFLHPPVVAAASRRAVHTVRLICPATCHPDHGVNGRRELERWRGSGIERHCRNTQCIILVAPGWRRHRRPGGAALLAERPALPWSSLPSQVAVELSLAPNIAKAPSSETLTQLQDWLASSAQLPLASTTARRIMPHGPENAAIMLLSEAPTLEDFAAGQPIGGESWDLVKTNARRESRSPPVDQSYSASLSCFHRPWRANRAQMTVQPVPKSLGVTFVSGQTQTTLADGGWAGARVTRQAAAKGARSRAQSRGREDGCDLSSAYCAD